MDKQDADEKADFMIETLLKTQPQLFSNVTPHGSNGKAVADFIAALHADLSATYQKRN